MLQRNNDKYFVPNTPRDDVYKQGPESKQLEDAINDHRITNVAVIGSYGVGKSSFVASVLKKNERSGNRYKVLKISMMNFGENDPSKGADKNATKIHVLRHLISQVSSYSQAVNEKNIRHTLVIFLVFVSSAVMLLLPNWPFGTSEILDSLPQIIDEPISLHSLYILLFLNTSVFLVWFIWRLGTKIIIMKITGFRIGKVEFDFEKNNNHIGVINTLQTALFRELVIIKSRAKKSIVIVEDIDRYNEVDLIMYLYEINENLNKRFNKLKQQYRTDINSKFIYCIKADVMITKTDSATDDGWEKADTDTTDMHKVFDVIIWLEQRRLTQVWLNEIIDNLAEHQSKINCEIKRTEDEVELAKSKAINTEFTTQALSFVSDRRVFNTILSNLIYNVKFREERDADLGGEVDSMRNAKEILFSLILRHHFCVEHIELVEKFRVITEIFEKKTGDLHIKANNFKKQLSEIKWDREEINYVNFKYWLDKFYDGRYKQYALKQINESNFNELPRSSNSWVREVFDEYKKIGANYQEIKSGLETVLGEIQAAKFIGILNLSEAYDSDYKYIYDDCVETIMNKEGRNLSGKLFDFLIFGMRHKVLNRELVSKIMRSSSENDFNIFISNLNWDYPTTPWGLDLRGYESIILNDYCKDEVINKYSKKIHLLFNNSVLNYLLMPYKSQKDLNDVSIYLDAIFKSAHFLSAYIVSDDCKDHVIYEIPKRSTSEAIDTLLSKSNNDWVMKIPEDYENTRIKIRYRKDYDVKLIKRLFELGWLKFGPEMAKDWAKIESDQYIIEHIQNSIDKFDSETFQALLDNFGGESVHCERMYKYAIKPLFMIPEKEITLDILNYIKEHDKEYYEHLTDENGWYNKLAPDIISYSVIAGDIGSFEILDTIIKLKNEFSWEFTDMVWEELSKNYKFFTAILIHNDLPDTIKEKAKRYLKSLEIDKGWDINSTLLLLEENLTLKCNITVETLLSDNWTSEQILRLLNSGRLTNEYSQHVLINGGGYEVRYDEIMKFAPNLPGLNILSLVSGKTKLSTVYDIICSIPNDVQQNTELNTRVRVFEKFFRNSTNYFNNLSKLFSEEEMENLRTMIKDKDSY